MNWGHQLVYHVSWGCPDDYEAIISIDFILSAGTDLFEVGTSYSYHGPYDSAGVEWVQVFYSPLDRFQSVYSPPPCHGYEFCASISFISWSCLK